jgi:hypothetical protein
MPSDPSFAISVAALLVSIAVNFLGSLFIYLNGRADRKEARRKAEAEARENLRREQMDYYMEHLRPLRDLRAKLQGLQYGTLGTPNTTAYEEGFGAAYSLMMSVQNKAVRDLAPQVNKGEYQDRLIAIDMAIQHLGDLLVEAMEKP